MTKFILTTPHHFSFNIDIYKTASKKKIIDIKGDFVFLLNMVEQNLLLEKVINLKTHQLDDNEFHSFHYYGSGMFSNNDTIIDGESGKDSGDTPYNIVDSYSKSKLSKKVNYS